MDSGLRGLIVALLALACGCDQALIASDSGSGLDGSASSSDAGPHDARVATADAARDSGPPDAGAPRVPMVFVGLSTGDVISYSLEMASGTLTERSRTRTGANPSFMSASPDGRHLYVVHENAAEVAALAVTPGTGAVTVVDRAATDGDGPTHVATSPDGRFVMVANYGAGSVALFPVLADGTLGERIDTESPGPRAHQVVFDASGTLAYVPCLGADSVAQFAVSMAGLEPLSPPLVAVSAGDGPRHMALSLDERFAYVIHELGSVITVHPRAASGALGTSIQRISTLPMGSSGANSTAEILVHPNGRLVLGSNRGHDSIVRYSISTDGTLRALGHEPTRGRTPRSMALTPDGSLLLVANQGSRDVQVFRVDDGGALAHLGGLETDEPVPFVGVFEIPIE